MNPEDEEFLERSETIEFEDGLQLRCDWWYNPVQRTKRFNIYSYYNFFLPSDNDKF